jgi:hypothetical protein
MIGDDVEVRVLSVDGAKVRIGIGAPSQRLRCCGNALGEGLVATPSHGDAASLVARLHA